MNKAEKLIRTIEGVGVDPSTRFTIRKSTYRSKPGFLVSWRRYKTADYPGDLQSVFFVWEEEAKEFIKRMKAGEDSETILTDIWGIEREKGEIFRGVRLSLGTDKWN